MLRERKETGEFNTGKVHVSSKVTVNRALAVTSFITWSFNREYSNTLGFWELYQFRFYVQSSNTQCLEMSGSKVLLKDTNISSAKIFKI